MKSSSPISRLKVRDWLLRVTLKYMYVVSNIPTGCLSFPFGPFPPPFSTPASCVLPLVQEYTFGLPETCSRRTDEFFSSYVFFLESLRFLPFFASFSPSLLFPFLLFLSVLACCRLPEKDFFSFWLCQPPLLRLRSPPHLRWRPGNAKGITS